MGGGGAPNISSLVPTSDGEYTATLIPVDNWNTNELTAHQLRPLRMAIIAGSFPYKQQLEEHKHKLRLSSTDAVLSEPVDDIGDQKDKKDKVQAFRFLGVDVERQEVDADGKKITEWVKLPLAASYQMWLDQTYVPFQPEDPKLEQVRFPGLAMPLLREFHANKASAPGLPGMAQLMGAGRMQPGGLQPSKSGPEEGAVENDNTSKAMEQALKKLPKLQGTLAKLTDVQPKQIAAPKFRQPKLVDAFNPNVSLSDDAPQAAAPDKNANAGQDYIPDYALVRVVDVNVEPGHRYHYRLRVRMANPNYKRDDVASPEYKEAESLVSEGWAELRQTVSVPQESFSYVVDEAQGVNLREKRQIPAESAQAELWRNNPNPDQVVMQFQRWLEWTARSRKDAELVPVGDWTLADRVLVTRGEYIGRKVKVDIPIWIYTRNAFILPNEDKSGKTRVGRVKTGIDVDFGEENPESNLILVDFEGGRVNIPSSKADDTCPIEVLMLSPDGKLLARNSLKDTNDGARQKRRDEVLKRVQEVRAGK
jgi:hypothetical protein